MMIESLDFVRHPDDDGYDEIQLIDAGSQAPILRLATFYRWKTSGLSGDEWRVSVGWQRQGDRSRGDDPWVDFDGPYRDVEAGCAAIYAGIYTSHPGLHDIPVGAVLFMRKDRTLWRSTYEGKACPLLVVCGHLPWALIQARETACWPAATESWDRTRCFQPGCAVEAVATFAMLKRYCRNGHESPATHAGLDGKERTDARRFCRKHLRRGDCALEDADANYRVVEGPGPNDAHDFEQHESQSQFGGVVHL